MIFPRIRLFAKDGLICLFQTHTWVVFRRALLYLDYGEGFKYGACDYVQSGCISVYFPGRMRRIYQSGFLITMFIRCIKNYGALFNQISKTTNLKCTNFALLRSASLNQAPSDLDSILILIQSYKSTLLQIAGQKIVDFGNRVAVFNC